MANPTSKQDQQVPMHRQDIKADILKKLSRRNWLRNAAITASGTVLLPSFLTGCTKEQWDDIRGHVPNGGGLGEEELTQADLAKAAKNIDLMRILLADLYQRSFDYDITVLEALSSTTDNNDWAGFIADIFIDIAIEMATAVFPEAAAPAIALFSDIMGDWSSDINRPPDLSGLNAFFAEYQRGQLAMAKAIDEKLAELIDVGNNYANLRTWKDPILFNKKPYTLKDLAGTQFPDKHQHGVDYYKIFNPMYDHHRRSVWNLAIMKCCTYSNAHYEEVRLSKQSGALLEYAQKTFYPAHKGVYLRANFMGVEADHYDYELVWWNLGIGGKPFPDSASSELFIDYTPGNIINTDDNSRPHGLFNRSYVFQQFSFTKPDFSAGHELNGNPANGHGDFALSDDWTFTRGLFPKVTE
jgi:hypothetical protein